MKKPLTKTRYYYCEDYNKYVKRDWGIFYCIENGKEIRNDFYAKISIGDIYTKDITEKEYNDQLY